MLPSSQLRAWLAVAAPFTGDNLERRSSRVLSAFYPPFIHLLSTFYPPFIHLLSTFYPPGLLCNFFCPRRCASCSTCNRVLDVSSAVAGQDNGLYCQVQDFESNSCSWCDKHFRVMSDFVKIQQSQLVRDVTVGNMEGPAFEEQVLQLGRLRTLAGHQLQMLRCQVGCNRYIRIGDQVCVLGFQT